MITSPGGPRAAVFLVLWALLASSGRATAQSVGQVTGIIVDQESGEPLRSASLEILGTDIRGPASDDGRFRLPPLEAGTITLRIFHLGYEPRTETVTVLEGQTVDVRIALSRNPTYELDPVTVSVHSPVLERRGFYERRRQGYAGTFLTREDILERNPQNASELFNGMSGLKVLPGDLDGPQVVFQRAVSIRDSGVCRPAIYFDGVKSQIRLFDNIIDPAHIEGIEVYVGAGVPAQYNDPCGAILFWTRTGARR